jgi:hypothetical protein
MARTTDPWTSHEAKKSVKLSPEKISGILSLLKQPMTDEQMVEAYQAMEGLPWASPSGLRTLRANLYRNGMVENTGEVANTRSGRKSIIWRTV